ncbi:MAG: hypothetical protein RL434_2514 [Pseudomonadota bacterium]
MPRFQGWVVKLGGSLGDSPRLMPWLSALAQPAARCIVVPGGGRFADAVRMAQADWGLADDAAHAMALLAMAQYGLALHARAPTLAVARGLEGLERTDPTGPRLWLPELADQLALDRDGLPRDWSLSSDSLALWLANRLDAKALVLVKSLEGQGTWNCTAAQLQDFSAQGVLDTFFPNLRPACPVHVLAAGCDPGNLPGLCSSAG